ncbi:PHP domain-containing protein [Chitinispirillales bacterium ANBcel5]|uniref:PHP domain-containing protein n=1 Tax=Cellulosispirillum alkaliphilum TaxID=3039283 RepID=UPI002A5814F1|nr:PHP domain-containing protein [Chitinispirillales bacterium ANBcel5]
MLCRADLHIHSCLSPCASLDMSPSAIVKTAVDKGLNCLALTDHNCALNCATMERVCREAEVFFIPGLEITTSEEAHILCLFESTDKALAFSKEVYTRIPDVENVPEKFGDQVYVDEEDGIEGMVNKYLGLATDISVEQLRDMVLASEGLLIPAHIDKPVFSLISQLGFISGQFNAVELSKAYIKRGHPLSIAKHYTAISSSDSHYISDIGSIHIEFAIEFSPFHSLKNALEQKSVQIKETVA